MSGLWMGMLALSVLAGCGGGGDGKIYEGPPPARPNIVTPASATVARGAQQQFTAVLTVGANPVWNVQGKGTITNTGLYTAPDTPGTYTISVSNTNNTSEGGGTVITVP